MVRFRDRKGEVVVRTDRIARQLNEAFGRQLGDLKRPELENRRRLVRQGDVFSVFAALAAFGRSLTLTIWLPDFTVAPKELDGQADARRQSNWRDHPSRQRNARFA